MSRLAYLLLLLALCAGAGAEAAQPAVVSVPNLDRNAAPCVVALPPGPARCTAQGCALPLPKGSTMASLDLGFSCIPTGSTTEFDRPPPYARIQSLRTANGRAHLSLIDDIDAPPAERLRELGFCIHGRDNIFCGHAKVLRLQDGAKGDATPVVKAFIQGLGLQGALPPAGRAKASAGPGPR